MNTNQVSNNTAITLSFVFVSVLVAVGLILFEGTPAGVLFFVGYMIIAAISSIFKDKGYYSRRALG